MIGSTTLRVVEPADLWRALPDALDGHACLAPTCDPATVAMLRPEVPVAEPDAALIVATSGSTGRPRGVVLSRDALIAGARATHGRLGGAGTWHCALPVSYVAGVMTLVRAHVAGTDPAFVAKDLHDLGVRPGRNYLSLVPTQLHRALASDDLAERLRLFDAILIGGASLDPALRADADAAGLPIVTTYGMSETCGGCVYDGVPLPGVDVALDAAGRVSIGGPVLFCGYRLDPERTASTLVDGHIVTSDRGRWDGDRLQILGRLDDVVVTGGVNVDLADVQRHADAAFGTPEAGGIVVFGVPDTDWGTRIVAVTTSDLTTDDVRATLGERVARPALPHEVRHLIGLPRTPSGKIDKQSLQADWKA